MSDDSVLRHPYHIAQVGEGLKNLTERIVGKKSAVLGQMLFNWKHIVGDSVGSKTIPLKLAYPKSSSSGAVLYLSVKSAYAAEITQIAPAVIEKINTFIGFGAIKQIRLVHLTSPGHSVIINRKKDPVLSEADEKRLDADISAIEDPKLKNTLKSFGRRIIAEEAL